MEIYTVSNFCLCSKEDRCEVRVAMIKLERNHRETTVSNTHNGSIKGVEANTCKHPIKQISKNFFVIPC